jgi:hypothetical protein
MARSRGFTQDITTCDHCGKADLKGTYAVDDNGKITYYGSICITQAFGKRTGSALRERARIINRLQSVVHRSAWALQWYGWGTKEGWIVDGIGQRVIEAA